MASFSTLPVELQYQIIEAFVNNVIETTTGDLRDVMVCGNDVRWGPLCTHYICVPASISSYDLRQSNAMIELEILKLYCVVPDPLKDELARICAQTLDNVWTTVQDLTNLRLARTYYLGRALRLMGRRSTGLFQIGVPHRGRKIIHDGVQICRTQACKEHELSKTEPRSPRPKRRN